MLSSSGWLADRWTSGTAGVQTSKGGIVLETTASDISLIHTLQYTNTSVYRPNALDQTNLSWEKKITWESPHSTSNLNLEKKTKF